MSLTCISCKVIFSTSELQREHYKNDWHRYNLKRKIADLPPVTKEEFDSRAAAYNAAPSEKGELACDLCHRKFVSQNSLLNHMKSKKHIENYEGRKNSRKVPGRPKIFTIPKTDEKEEITEEVEDDEEYESDDGDWESCGEDDSDNSLPLDVCLFCSMSNEDLEANVKHMTVEHSFFIPDIEYLVDLKGLIMYLGHKVGNGYLCLWCDTKGKSFHSLQAVQKHMLDKGHCKLLHEGEALLSYADFYDYSASYPEGGDADEEVMIPELDADDYELVLPSGAVIGHRSLAQYYKQNLPPLKDPKTRALSGVMQHYKALGWTGTSGEAAVRKAKDLDFLQRMQTKRNLKLAVKHNKFQPHFRAQIMF